MAVFAVIYGTANVLLALAWWRLLRHLGAWGTAPGSIRIYGISQLAKYAPGNIFHLAGRQALGMAAGLPAGVLVKSAIWELGLIAVTASLFGWLIVPLVSPGFPETASLFLLLGSVAFVGVLLRRKVGSQTAWAFLWQILFLFISGALFVALLTVIAGDEGGLVFHWLSVAGAYTVAWLAGLVTPGAPAGVGVREMVLVLLLGSRVPETDLLMAVLLGRLVTVIGDLLFFMAAFLIPAKRCIFEGIHARESRLDS